jgi:hypothetical protein
MERDFGSNNGMTGNDHLIPDIDVSVSSMKAYGKHSFVLKLNPSADCNSNSGHVWETLSGVRFKYFYGRTTGRAHIEII